MFTALYSRVSTEQQVDKESLGMQRAQLEAYCKSQGITEFRHYTETGKSAKDTNRPQLRQLLQAVRSGKVAAVVVTRLDRITRSILDLWKLIREFHQHQVDFVSLAERIDTEGPAGRFLINILASLAQFEREIIARRVAEAMHHRALQGKWNGGPIPFGYTTQARILNELIDRGTTKDQALKAASTTCPEEKLLYPDKVEAKIVQQLFKIYIETRSIRETARKLNTLGYRTRKGSRWSTTTVSRILTTNTYIGKMCYGKRKTDLDTGKTRRVKRDTWTIVDGLQDGLISTETFKLAQEVLASTSQKPKRRNRFYPLSGLLKCGKCGRSMHGYTYIKPNGSRYSYYKCPRKRSYDNLKACRGLTIPADSLESFTANTLTSLSKDQSFLSDKQRMLDILRDEIEQATSTSDDELGQLKQEHNDLESRREALLECLERRVIDDSLFKERYEVIMTSLEENRMAQERKQHAASKVLTTKECLEASFKEIASFGKNWDLLDHQGRASLLQTIIQRIDVTEKEMRMKIYVDRSFSSVEALSRTGRDSSRRSG